jgi:hypothetical protein
MDEDGQAYEVFAVMPFGMFDTIIRFQAHPLREDGTPNTELTTTIAADHRPARDIREALMEGERPIVRAQSWAVLDSRETVVDHNWPVDHEEGE